LRFICRWDNLRNNSDDMEMRENYKHEDYGEDRDGCLYLLAFGFAIFCAAVVTGVLALIVRAILA
jgi:hypothetical protein